MPRIDEFGALVPTEAEIQRSPRAAQRPDLAGLLNQFTGGVNDFLTSEQGQIASGLLSASKGQFGQTGGFGSRVAPAIQNVLNQQSKRGLFDAQAFNQLAQATAGPKPEDSFRPATKQERIDNNVPDISSAQVNTRTGKLTITHPPRNTPLVSIAGDQQELEGDKVLGKSRAERHDKRIAAAEEGISQNRDLDRVALALSRGAQTGGGEEFLLDLKQFGNTFLGLDLDDAAREGEVIRKVSNEMALRLRNPDSGLGLTGNTSNKDLDFLKASVLGLSRSEGGNLLIIRFMKRKNQLKQDIVAEQARLVQANGGKLPANLDTQLIKFVNDYEFFTPGEQQEIETILGNQRQADLAAGVPQSAVDDGVTAAMWNVFTPEAKELYQ
jgi:hypothetical protein